MPENITIANYSNKPLAHPLFPTIMPGESRTRRIRQVDVDSYDQTYDRMSEAGIYVAFDEAKPSGYIEVEGAHTAEPDQHLIVAKAGGITVTLPALADVPMGHRVTVAKKEGDGDVTVTPAGGNTIGGQPNATVSGPTEGVRLRKDNDTDWTRL